MPPSAISTPSASGAAPITEPMSMRAPWVSESNCALGSASRRYGQSRRAAAITIPVTKQTRQENTNTFSTLMVIGVPPMPTRVDVL